MVCFLFMPANWRTDIHWHKNDNSEQTRCGYFQPAYHLNAHAATRIPSDAFIAASACWAHASTLSTSLDGISMLKSCFVSVCLSLRFFLLIACPDYKVSCLADCKSWIRDTISPVASDAVYYIFGLYGKWFRLDFITELMILNWWYRQENLIRKQWIEALPMGWKHWKSQISVQTLLCILTFCPARISRLNKDAWPWLWVVRNGHRIFGLHMRQKIPLPFPCFPLR